MTCFLCGPSCLCGGPEIVALKQEIRDLTRRLNDAESRALKHGRSTAVLAEMERTAKWNLQEADADDHLGRRSRRLPTNYYARIIGAIRSAKRAVSMREKKS